MWRIFAFDCIRFVRRKVLSRKEFCSFSKEFVEEASIHLEQKKNRLVIAASFKKMPKKEEKRSCTHPFDVLFSYIPYTCPYHPDIVKIDSFLLWHKNSIRNNIFLRPEVKPFPRTLQTTVRLSLDQTSSRPRLPLPNDHRR